jgi:hypothetical protein
LLAKPNVVVGWLILIIKHEEKRSIGGVGVDGRIVEDNIMDFWKEDMEEWILLAQDGEKSGGSYEPLNLLKKSKLLLATIRFRVLSSHLLSRNVKVKIYKL